MNEPVITTPELSRAERRRRERDARKAQASLNVSVSRLEFSQQLAPLVTAGQQHELILSFLLDRGLLVRDGRAVLDTEEFNAYLAEKNAERAAASQPAEAAAA